MLTVNYQRLGLQRGDRLLDLGCGAGRHAFQALRLGARVVAFDYDEGELKDVTSMVSAMGSEGQVPAEASASGTRGDATALPFGDGTFDRIIASEVLEHIGEDEAAIAELARVLRPGGTMAVTVPAWLAERLCWALSEEYHAPAAVGGHVRIYRAAELRGKLETAGLRPRGSHHEHGIHSPYWWLRCAVGPNRDDHPLVQAYHKVLVWDIAGTRPWSYLTRTADTVLSPVIGKSIVLYARKPLVDAASTRTPAAPLERASEPAGTNGQTQSTILTEAVS
jgi:SAM-dependent methyltransferase